MFLLDIWLLLMGKIKWFGGWVFVWCLVGCLIVWLVDCLVGAAETAAPPMRAAWIWQDAISSYGRRTESDRVADGIRLDGGRNLIGRRTESDWVADGL